MKIAYLDLFCGLSGDITLGALVDAGLPLAELRRGLSALPLLFEDEREIPQGGGLIGIDS